MAEFLQQDELIKQYLARLSLNQPPPMTVDGLEQLMRAHMSAVPFENLDVYWQQPVSTDAWRSLEKVLNRKRGGWCFELNGAFGQLLVALGYEVRHLGAAVLLDGPNKVVDHLTLEVRVEDRPHLVDVGFGDGFARPLPLNSRADVELDGFTARFGFMTSPDGVTLVRYVPDNSGSGEPVLVPQYRFRRVSLTPDQLAAASQTIYDNSESNFRQGPLATRLVDGGPDRVTLSTDRLRLMQDGQVSDTPIEPGTDTWFNQLEAWFGFTPEMLPPALSQR